MRRYKSRKVDFKKALSSCLIVFLILLILHLTDSAIWPSVWSLAEQAVCQKLSTVLSDSVIQSLEAVDFSYSSVSKMNFSPQGTVTSVDYDFDQVNKLKLNCNEILSQKLSKLKKTKIKIPVGDLLGNLNFSGRGPNLKIKLSQIAYPNISLVSSFTDCGINQTAHEIRLAVEVSAKMFLLPNSKEIKFSQEYILAKTIIVGDVPQGYFLLE